MSKETKKPEPTKLQRFMAATGQPKITAQVILASASAELQKALTAAGSPEEFATTSKAIVGEYYKATDATEEQTVELPTTDNYLSDQV